MEYSFLSFNSSTTSSGDRHLGPQSEPIEFTWTIPGFSDCRRVASVDSDRYKFDGSDLLKLHIYASFPSNQSQNDSPESRHDASDKRTEIFLRVNEKVKSNNCCNMEISVMNARGNKFQSKILHERIPFERRFKFISTSELHDKTNDLLPNGRLSIHFLLFHMKRSCRVEECQYAARTQNPLQLLADFAKLYTTKLNSDVIFRVQNTNIAAHSAFLTARSPVFAAMFQHHTKEKESGEVDIPDVTPAVFDKMLQFIYTGECQVGDSAEELLMAADKYDIRELKRHCELELREYALYVDTAIDLLVLSDLYDAKILRERVVKLIKLNVAQLKKRPEWEDLEKNYEHLAREFDVEN
jgi:BTB/POZ domain